MNDETRDNTTKERKHERDGQRSGDDNGGRGESVVVIGAGPGGYPAAFRAADLGFDVTLIDKREQPGGVCLHEGCIPSKTLLHVAELIREAEHAEQWGVRFGKPRIDEDDLRAFSQRVIDRQAKGLRALCKKHGVKLVRGEARFTDAHTLTVELPGDDNGGDAKTEEITFDHAVIATGSRPAPLKLGEDSNMDSDDVITSTQGLNVDDIPKSLLVIGGGYIGLEMGSVYAALRSKVTVVEMTDGLLPGVDDDLVKPLHKALESRFDEILLRSRVVEMKPYKYGMSVKLVDGDGNESHRRFSKVLVAVGRVPCSDSLDLDSAGIERDDGGFIKVNAQRRTSASHIYAIGDVAGQPMLAHKATHEGRVAADTIADLPAAFDPAAIPAVVFTDPDVAWTGLTETEALEEGIDIRIARFDWRASGRAGTFDRPHGLTKLILQPRTHRVLGVGMVGPHAGELIAEGTLAVEMGATAADLHATIHPHPTLSETLMDAAAGFQTGLHLTGERRRET